MIDIHDFFILTSVFLLIYILFLLPAFKDIVYIGKFIRRKVLLAVLLGMFFSCSDQGVESDTYAFLVLLVALVYASVKLAEECPNGYAESVFPVLKAMFIFITAFTSFDLKGEELGGTIATVTILLVLWGVTWFSMKRDYFEAKSKQLELMFLYGEHFIALVISYFITSNYFARIVLMALFEEIILVVVHLAVMYVIKILCHEDTTEYAAEKRKELLF